jgi:uncharacterized repeat protein (TIGR01451 family)
MIYAGPAASDEAGRSALSQVVYIPTGSASPVVSLVYQLAGASPGGGTGLSVDVQDAKDTTTVFSTSTNTAGWAHGWADLSDWSGQTVRLLVEVTEEEGQACAWAYVDEVTVGSAYPDLWVDATGAQALPGEEVTFSITYANRGGVAAQGVQISASLAEGLEFVSADPAPTLVEPDLVWEVGSVEGKSAPMSILVTARIEHNVPLMTWLVSPVEVASETSEVELTNNQAESTVFVGYRTYFPVAGRQW